MCDANQEKYDIKQTNTMAKGKNLVGTQCPFFFIKKGLRWPEKKTNQRQSQKLSCVTIMYLLFIKATGWFVAKTKNDTKRAHFLGVG